MAMVLS
jgi:hypothetical protein